MLISFAIVFALLIIGGAMWIKTQRDRNQVDALRGVLTGTIMDLERRNDYVEAIFKCYNDLLAHFRKYGFMKKVFETTQEFNTAVRAAASMVPTDQLDAFLGIFEEARYSSHDIGPTHRDRAIATLTAVNNSLTMSLGETGTLVRKDLVGLYDNQTKAGEFVAADGTVRQAGLEEGNEDSGFSI